MEISTLDRQSNVNQQKDLPDLSNIEAAGPSRRDTTKRPHIGMRTTVKADNTDSEPSQSTASESEPETEPQRKVLKLTSVSSVPVAKSQYYSGPLPERVPFERHRRPSSADDNESSISTASDSDPESTVAPVAAVVEEQSEDPGE